MKFRNHILLFALLITSKNSWASDNMMDVINLVEEPEKVKDYWVPLHNQRPEYPRNALERGLSGCAIFLFTISSKGRAKDITLIDSAPKHYFEKNARQALQWSSWKTSSTNKKKTPVRTTREIKFQLQGAHDDSIHKCERTTPMQKKTPPQTCESSTGSRLLKTCS